MLPDLSTMLALLGGLCVSWCMATWAVALGAVRFGERMAARWGGSAADRWLPPEAWMALAASGAAAGGFVSYTTAAAWDIGSAGWPGSLLPIAVIGALGMVAGAGFACGCAAAYLWSTSD